MGRYKIIESAEHGIEPVHGYGDLEIHHPSHHGHQPGRHYATVDGRREEVLKTPTSAGHVMVSKDFILTDERGSTHVPVPSPTAGYVGGVDPRNGVVRIYDRKGGELLAQIRHMDLHGSDIREGQTVAYGQPLGVQAGYGGGNPHAYGVHTHIDFNTSRLDDFKKYFSDIDGGVITVGLAPHARTHAALPAAGPATDHHARAPSHEHVAARHEDSLRHAQSALAHLGYTGADGRLVNVDGVWGTHSRHALSQFQSDRGLPVTGEVDPQTLGRLAADDRTLASSAHPANALFRQSLSAVEDLDRRMGIPGDPHTVALAGVAAAEAARAGLTGVDRIEMTHDRSHVQAVQFTGGIDQWATNRASAPIDVAEAVKRPLEVSSRNAEHAMDARQAVDRHIAQDRAPMRAPIF